MRATYANWFLYFIYFWKSTIIFPNPSSSFLLYTHGPYNHHRPHHHATLFLYYHNYHHLHRPLIWSDLTPLHSDLTFSLTSLTTSSYPLPNPWPSSLCPSSIMWLTSVWWCCWELRNIKWQRRRRLFVVKRGREIIKWSEKEENEKTKKKKKN